MQLINSALKRKKITSDQLSQDLQDRIKDFKEMVVSYNKIYDKWEEEGKDPELEQKLDEQEHELATTEMELAEEIKEYEVPAPTPDPTPDPAPAPAPEPKEDSSVGWLIFGAVVLVGTLGLVNVLKKK